MRLRVTCQAGESRHLDELQSAISKILDDVESPDSVTATSEGFELRSRDMSNLESVAGRIESLARARADADGLPITIERARPVVPMLPNRILARRIQTFGNSLGLRQDKVTRGLFGPPTPWGSVSFVTPTAIAKFAIEPEGADGRVQMRLMAKALASTGLDILGDMELRGFAEGEFIRGLRERGLRREPRRWLGVHPVLPGEHPRDSGGSRPSVVVRGPGLPEPTPDDLLREDEA
jgi:hypothetical protein